MKEGSQNAAVVAVFLNRLLADQQEGVQRQPEEYAALFPGDRSTIARELAKLSLMDEDSARGVIAQNASSLSGGLEDSPPQPVLADRYAYEEFLGRGAQGRVYGAEDLQLKRKVAVKTLDGWGALDQDAMDFLRREAEITSRLEHPGICRTYDIGVDHGVPFIVMERIRGEPLSTLLGPSRFDAEVDRLESSLAPAKASRFAMSHQRVAKILHFIIGCAEALQLAHEKGIVHRDLKPGNIMVRDDGTGVILDFGIARDESRDDTLLPNTSRPVGTPPYMSPEHLRGEGVDRRSDVWALGAILHECLTNHRPFAGPSPVSVEEKIKSSPAPRLDGFPTGLSRDLQSVVDTALAKDSSQRFADARTMAEDLGRILAGEPVLSRRQGIVSRSLMWARRHRAAAALLLVLGLSLPIIGGLGAYAWLTREDVAAAKEQAFQADIESRLQEAFVLGSEGEREASWNILDGILDDVPGHGLAQAAYFANLDFLNEASVADELRQRLRPRLTQTKHKGRIEWLLNSASRKVIDTPLNTPESLSTSDATSDFLLGMQQFLWSQGQAFQPVQRAHTSFKSAVQKAPKAVPLFHFAMTMTAIRLHDRAECLRLANCLQVLWPDSPPAVLMRANALAEARKVKEALEAYEICKQQGFLTDTGRMHWARLLIRSGRAPEGEVILQEVLDRKPTHLIALRSMSRAKRSQRDKAGTERYLREALQHHPRDLIALNDLSQLLVVDPKRLDEAHEIADRIIEIYPKSHMGAYAKAVIAQTKGDFKERLKWANIAAETEPKAWEPYWYLGWTHYRLKNYERAELNFRKTKQFGPKGMGCEGLGYTLIKLGQSKQAFKSFNESIKYTPEKIRPHRARAELLISLGRWEQASTVLKSSLKRFPHDKTLRKLAAQCTAKLQAVTAIKEQVDSVSDAKTAIELATKLVDTKDAGLAVGLFAKAFELEPALSTDIVKPHLLNATASAASWLLTDPKAEAPRDGTKAWKQLLLWLSSGEKALTAFDKHADLSESKQRRLVRSWQKNRALTRLGKSLMKSPRPFSTTNARAAEFNRLWTAIQALE